MITRPTRYAAHATRRRALALTLAAACVLASAPAFATNIAATTEVIAGRQVELATYKNADAHVCVVFENGSRATVDSWSKVINLLTPAASVFAYNRPGYGHSQKTDTPRDGSTVVEELRQLLQQNGQKPPYVLVGHSLGGLYMQLFARRYPDEVAGLILVDSAYPGVIKKPEDFPWLTRAAKRVFFSSTVNQEIDLIHATGEQVLALGPIDDKPIIELINRPTGATAIPVDFGVVNTDPKVAEQVKAMYPKATRMFIDSDHQMQTQSPAEVADAIKKVIAMQTARK